MNFSTKIQETIQLIFTWNPSDRLWQMPFFAGLSVAIVLFIAAFFNRPDLGLVAIIGTNIFLYVPNTPIYHKMILCMACAFGITASFTLGLVGQTYPMLIPLIVFFVTMISAQIVRYFNIGAPGFFFFTFAMILGTYIPFEVKDYPFAIGLVALGTMIANVMVLLYSLSVIYLFKHPPKPIPKIGEFGFGVIIIDPIIIAFFVSASMVLQSFLELERGYWVGVSCAAILTAVTFKQIWIKQIQRILGTILGVSFSYFLLHFSFSPIQFALLMMLLMFFAELTVVRNYALAMIFLTPYSTYLAEVASFMNYNPDLIIKARILDITIGSLFGLLGGVVLHWQALRQVLEKILRKIIFRWIGED
ncbi:FUSC family protein [Helicobacter sp. MIT 05-5294]|uniref:FUSC family protein n=1 Tax=Helicobacter sp. MIT 05-5294 TaxID=1548150 RepID=UPI00051FBF5A|nr:FUSC family protein [Helicobacter sp. MIT 05-5294]TLD89194.1 FUSC family protein [Helicobacter sp. MIT 05-5294]